MIIAAGTGQRLFALQDSTAGSQNDGVSLLAFSLRKCVQHHFCFLVKKKKKGTELHRGLENGLKVFA